MAATIESKSRKASAKQTKVCLKCGQSKQLTDFYSNRDWDAQLGKDAWCKTCVGRCVSMDEMREYFWENHRDWNDRIWDAAQKKALALANTNATYEKSSEERRMLILERLTCQQVPALMSTYYKYVDPTKTSKS